MKLHEVAYVLVGAVIEPTGCTPCFVSTYSLVYAWSVVHQLFKSSHLYEPNTSIRGRIISLL